MALWHGRSDDEAADRSLRWHQAVRPWREDPDLAAGTVILGFRCDEGVRRNHGRAGAREGPRVLRGALANLVCAREHNLYDAGDIESTGEALEEAQAELATRVARILHRGDRPILLGGGHEMAFASYLGLARYLDEAKSAGDVGIVSLDAHFDLRAPSPLGNSGTPFRQIADWCREQGRRFSYMVLGINPAANTRALFQYAIDHEVRWFTDVECTPDRLPTIEHSLATFIARHDHLYLTICLDVLPAAFAPGVSAPSAPGVDPVVIIDLIQTIKALSTQHGAVLHLSEVAEFNPQYDLDGRTALIAARIVYELVN